MVPIPKQVLLRDKTQLNEFAGINFQMIMSHARLCCETILFVSDRKII